MFAEVRFESIIQAHSRSGRVYDSNAASSGSWIDSKSCYGRHGCHGQC